MIILRIFTGLALITLGRRLFWLFVGAIGLAVGIALAGQLFPNQTDLMQIIIAIIAGMIGAVLAITLQRLALIAAGFLGGGYLVYTVLDLFAVRSELLVFGAILLGALIGASLISKLFEVGLVVISSLIGSMLIIQSFELGPAETLIGFVIVAVSGILIQMATKKKPKD